MTTLSYGVIGDVEIRRPASPAHATPSRRRWIGRRSSLSLALLPLILAAQAVLSLRLIWVNTAFQDEALYLWAGHLEIAHWLHGTPIPAFPTYFSGAPVAYPPLAALADSLGGLAAARILSLIMMLGATALLWCTASTLFGRRPAFFAAALWAVLGPTIQLGAFATFDAMSLCLMALAACCAVRAGRSRQATGWMLGAAGALALSDITTYSALIFDPVVFALAALSALDRFEWPVARSRLTSLLAYLVTVFAILAKLGGTWYLQGIAHTVLARVSGTTSVMAVLRQSWQWTGLIVLLAGLAAVTGLVTDHGRARKLILLTLLTAALLVPAEQARIHTTTSLDKHADAGAWFAAIACGYGISRLIALSRPRALRSAASLGCAAALCYPATAGAAQAVGLNRWPNAAAFVTWLRPVADRRTGPMLIETPSIAEYYLPAGGQWQRWSSTFNITLPDGREVEHSGKIGYPGHPQTYRRFIAEGYFSVIALDHGLASTLDRALIGYIARNPRYRLTAVVPYGKHGYSVWLLTKAGK
jgi:hypothetical protein